MSDQRKPPGDEIADANSLFEDEPNWGRKPSHTPRAKPVQKPDSTPPDAVPLGGEYDVEGVEPDDESPPLRRTPIRPSPPRTKKPSRPRPEEEPEERRETIDESNVEEVWTRWGEWGPALTRMGIVAVVVLALVYFAGFTGVGILIFVVGFASLVAMSYPIAVTLERPMRLTPEQAVKDYYAAASHHFPQFRRMWLLLSDEGRDSAEFDSYAEFRSYWIRRMAQVRGDRIKKFTPLAFSVKEFRSDKSAGQTAIEAEYTIAVRARGATSGSTEEFQIEGSLVRGPDKMWYLNSGLLPELMPTSRDRKNS